MQKLTIGCLFVVCCLFALGASPALAHKVIASVFASGDAVEGEIGSSDGAMAGNVLVEVFDGDGNKVGETTTDEEGFFRFKPTQRVIHVFRCDLGAGHVAEVRMELEDLPTIAAPAIQSRVQTSAAEPGAASAALTEAQQELVAEAVRREVTPLRREIAAYKEKNNLQTILGGIGYILGLFGIGFYVAGRCRLKKA